MELSRGQETVRGSLADYRRNLVNRIVQQTVTELAREKGITPDARRRWSKLVAQTEKTASTFEKTLMPTGDAREIESQPFPEQAVLVPILGKEEELEAKGPKS
jgi:transposase-like protein